MAENLLVIAIKKKFKCEKCPYSTKYKRDLIAHVNGIHENVRPYKCDLCSYAATFERGLKKHVKSVHHKIRTIQKKNFKCERCNFSAGNNRTNFSY